MRANGWSCDHPLLSVVVPMYNAESFIERCLGSIFNQRSSSFEVVVLDDASTDRSNEIVGKLAGAAPVPVRLVAHSRNLGVNIARNSGIEAARGEWCVLLDSDDELVDGALATISELASKVESTVFSMKFACRRDDGLILPAPMPAAPAKWNYLDYLEFLELRRDGLIDLLEVVRRSTFSQLRYPELRSSEDIYHLDFSAKYDTRFFGQVLRLYHRDAPNSITRGLRKPFNEQDPTLLADRAAGYRMVLTRHGKSLQRYAPGKWHQYNARLIVITIVLAARKRALRYSAEYLAASPCNYRAWALLLTAFTGRKVFLLLHSIRKSVLGAQRQLSTAFKGLFAFTSSD